MVGVFVITVTDPAFKRNCFIHAEKLFFIIVTLRRAPSRINIERFYAAIDESLDFLHDLTLGRKFTFVCFGAVAGRGDSFDGRGLYRK